MKDSHDTKLDRRSFLNRAAGVVGGSAFASTALSYGRILGANDRIALGHIGVGNRGRGLHLMVSQLKDKYNVETVAVCDLWKTNRERATATSERYFGRAPRSLQYLDELLALKDLDAVLIATPEHSHSPVLKATVEAGKDAYCEKPMGNVLADVKAARDAVKRSKRVVQIGTQHRSEPYQLAAREVVHSGVLGDGAAPRGALAQPRRPDPAERQRHAEPARATVEKRQVEAVQVVVLDHVRISGPDRRHQPADHHGFGGVALAVRFEDLDRARRVTQRDHEDPIALGVEPCRFEIDLHPPQVIEREIAEVGPARRHQVLLLGSQREHTGLAQLTEGIDLAPESARGPAEHRGLERPQVVRAHQIAERAGAAQGAIGDDIARAGRAGRLPLVGAEPLTEMAEVVEPIEQEPRPEPHVLADEPAGFGKPSPDRGPAVALGPDGDNPGCRVPAGVSKRRNHGPYAAGRARPLPRGPPS